jgi:AcrR family transcriptional regulator
MAKICTNEKTAIRQRWIAQGLLELMQKAHFEDISVTDLCRHLHLSRRSFYRYFRDLEDVLDTLMNQTFQNIVISNAPLTMRELEDNFRFWLNQKSLLTALVRSGMHGKLAEYTLKHAGEDSIKSYLSDEDQKMNLNQEIRQFVISGSTSLLISWYTDGFQKSPEQMAQIAYRMLYRPLLKAR